MQIHGIKRRAALALCAAMSCLLVGGVAQAGQLDQPNTTLGLIIGGLPSVTVSALPGTESLVALQNGSGGNPTVGHNIVASATVWSTVNFGPGTALFTGVPLISNLKFTVANKGGFLQDGFTVPSDQIGGGGQLGPGMGGILRLQGVSIISALAGGIQLPVSLNHVGGVMGETTMVTLLAQNITVTNGPFISAPIKITGVTSNIITIPARGNIQGVAFTLQPTPGETVMTPSTNGGYVSIDHGVAKENHTVTISGTNNLLSASKAGSVTVIAPLRIDTSNIAGTVPGSAKMVFNFVPEPGTMLLLVSGAVGLAVIGRRRMRK
jgi:PEP-CTERM motif